MDLKEINTLFKDLEKKKTQKNSNLRKLNKSKKKNSTQSNRSTREKQFIEEERKFVKNIRKILSEKLREKVLQRLDRLIKNPKEKRLNKVACALSALIEVLKSCGVREASYEYLISQYNQKVTEKYSAGSTGAIEFIKYILEKQETSLKGFISKQSIHKKKLGEILNTTIKEIPMCSV